MALWVDKHRPNTLSKLSIHNDITERLVQLAKSDEIPHLLVFGPPGAGKKTRVLCLLREIFGSGAEKVKIEHKSFKNASNKAIEITTLGSNYHIECNPSDVGTNDRFVVQNIIKEIASHSSLTSSTTGSSSKSFKIVLISEADRLSRQAQAGLRRTMEKYSAQCRIILLCNSPSKIIEPVRSRCLSVRIPAPSHEEIAQVLIGTAKKESCTCPFELAIKIAEQCDRNLRRSLLMLEAARVQSGSHMLQDNLPLPLPDWELYIVRVAREILQEQSPAKLLAVRDMLYELLTHCIPADVIFQTLARELVKAVDEDLKHEVCHWAAYYEHRVRLGSKDIFHLEAFVSKFMALYKSWLLSFFG